MHLTETRRIPKLGCEVSPFLDLLFVESDVLSARRNPHQPEPHAIGAIFRDQVERVRRIAERLRHLAPLLVANKAGQENIAKWDVIFQPLRLAWLELKPRDNHAGDPEENNVRPG